MEKRYRNKIIIIIIPWQGTWGSIPTHPALQADVLPLGCRGLLRETCLFLDCLPSQQHAGKSYISGEVEGKLQERLGKNRSEII